MASFSDPEEPTPQRDSPTIHFFFEQTVESIHQSRNSAPIEGPRDLVYGCRPLSFNALTHELACQSVPRLASGDDLLKAAALMWAHAMRFQWSISFAYKKFHLAPEMLLSNALWQPLTHPSDLMHRIAYPTVQGPGLRIDSRIAVLPAKQEKQLPVRFNLQGKEVGDIFYLIERDREIPGRQLDRWPSFRSSSWR